MSIRRPRMMCLALTASCSSASGSGDDKLAMKRKRQGNVRGHWTVEDKQERDFVLQKAVGAHLCKQLNLPPITERRAIFQRRTTVDLYNSVKTTARTTGDGMHGIGGFKLQLPLDFSQAERLREHYERHTGGGYPVTGEVAMLLLSEFRTKYLKMHKSPVVSLAVPKGGRVVIVGDTHGQLRDVITIFRKQGPPSKDNVYVFNGDICDRGRYACEIWFLAIAYFLADPASVVINRGNHEWESMNELHRTDGGGFLDEVRRKFNDHVYDRFVEVFKVLTLVTVIGETACVLHGGLSPDYGLTLDKIRQIPHTTTAQPDDARSEVDELWHCLLWSDPREMKGYEPSNRGIGINFGPDVTQSFFENNAPIKLLVRSHELPDEAVGYRVNHGKRCVTIFSASNYTGDAGNKGAVLVFDAKTFPEYQICEYYAPPMSRITALVAQKKGVDEWIQEGHKLFQLDTSAMDSVWWEKELRAIMVTIVESKRELYEHYVELTKGAPFVYREMWVRIMSDVCGQDWCWNRAWRHWELGKSSGKVNFIDFLRRFTVVLEKDEYMSFKFKVIVRIFKQIMALGTDLQETMKLFDTDGDGTVTHQELKEFLTAFDVGLTRAQMDTLIQAVFLGLPSMPIDEFMGRIAMLSKHAKDALVEREDTEEQRLLRELTQQLGHIIENATIGELTGQKHLTSPSGAAGDFLLASKLQALFEIADVSKTGRLSMDEFVDSIWRLPRVRQIRLSDGKLISQGLLSRLALHVDHDKTGSVEYLEWLHALSVDEGSVLEADILADNMISVLMRYRTPIRACCRRYDPRSKGSIARFDFQRILEELNAVIGETGNHWSKSQISDLCEAFALDGNSILYNTIFESLQVVDSQNASFAVRLTMPTSVE